MLSLLLVACLADPATEPADPTIEPKGAPPMLMAARIKDGKLMSSVMKAVPVTKQVVVEVEEGGVKKKVIQTVTEYVMVAEEHAFDLKGATITTADGKKLTPEAAAKRLTKTSVVVISTDGKAVHAGYLQALKKDTIVIVGALGMRGGVAPIATPVVVPVPAK